MIDQELKNKAFKLREKGLSYNNISTQTGISKGVLSYWFNSQSWSQHIALANKTRNLLESKERIARMNKARAEKLQKIHEKTRFDADQEYGKFKNDRIFVAGLMLYIGEGDKSKDNPRVRIGNIDVNVLSIFIKFLERYCLIPREKVRFWLLAYPDTDTNLALDWWSKKLNLTKNQLYKTQIIEGRHKTRKLLYGVGNIILSSRVLKVKILKWIDLISEDLA
jgi:hypothetical protein